MSYLLTDADKKEFAEIEGAEAEINEMTTDIVALEAYRDGLAVTTGQGLSLGKTARTLLNVGLGNIKHVQVSLEDAEGTDSVDADKGRMAKIGAKIKALWLKILDKIKTTIKKVGEFVKTRLSMADFYKRAAVKALAELKANPLSEEAVVEGWKVTANDLGKKITNGEASVWNNLTVVSELMKDTRDYVNVFIKQRTVYTDLANAVTTAMDKGVSGAADAFDFGSVEKANQVIDTLGKSDRWKIDTNRTLHTLVFLLAAPNNASAASKEATGASVATLTSALSNSGAAAKILSENNTGLLDTALFQRQISKIDKFVKTLNEPAGEKFNEFDKVAREVSVVLNESIFGFLAYYSQALGGVRLVVKTYEAARKAEKGGAKSKEGSTEEAGK